MTKAYHFETTETGDAVIVRLLEERLVDERIVQGLANQLSELIQKEGRSNLILDLSDVMIICSSLLGRLITLNKQVQTAGGMLRLCGISPRIYEVLAITKLNKLFDMHDSQQQALTARTKTGENSGPSSLAYASGYLFQRAARRDPNCHCCAFG
jgi:anti-sigma B factor antagonist